MKALSIRPPWAQFIVYGIPIYESMDNGDGSQSVKYSGKGVYKDVENRGWAIPTWFKLPQRIYIHASKTEDKFEDVLDLCCKKIGFSVLTILHMTSPLLGRGALIGEVDIVGCVRDSKSAWAASGQWHWLLANPKGYKVPIPCKGKLGFFEPDIDMLGEMKKCQGKI